MLTQVTHATDVRSRKTSHAGFPARLFGTLLLCVLTACSDPPDTRLDVQIKVEEGLDVTNFVLFAKTGSPSRYATGASVVAADFVGVTPDKRVGTITLTLDDMPTPDVLVAVAACAGNATCQCQNAACNAEQELEGPECRCELLTGFGVGSVTVSGQTVLDVTLAAIDRPVIRTVTSSNCTHVSPQDPVAVASLRSFKNRSVIAAQKAMVIVTALIHLNPANSRWNNSTVRV